MEFNKAEVEALTDMIAAWIAEGFTDEPYTDAQYGVFEKLGLDNDEGDYDTRRPADGRVRTR